MDFIRDFESKLANRVQEEGHFIQVLLGPRQVGKTTGVRRLFDAWDRSPKLMVSADDPSPRSSEWLRVHWHQARSMGKGTLFVVDEIQKVSGWAETAKLLFDEDRRTNHLRVVFLGSASLSIQEGLASALAGRFEVLKVAHWSAQECKEAFGWDLETYLQYGGYPAAARLIADRERWRSFILDSILEPVLGRDIAGIVRISKPALFRQAFELAMHYPSQVVSYSKLLGQLQDGGNTTTLRHYLELFEGAFLLRLIDKFSRGASSRKASSPKLLPLNVAIPQAYNITRTENDPSWTGRILESVVGAYLSTLPGKLFYWAEGDYEVDFIREIEGEIIAYEVKTSPTHSTKSLEKFLKQYPSAKVNIWDTSKIEDILTGKRVES